MEGAIGDNMGRDGPGSLLSKPDNRIRNPLSAQASTRSNKAPVFVMGRRSTGPADGIGYRQQCRQCLLIELFENRRRKIWIGSGRLHTNPGQIGKWCFLPARRDDRGFQRSTIAGTRQ